MADGVDGIPFPSSKAYIIDVFPYCNRAQMSPVFVLYQVALSYSAEFDRYFGGSPKKQVTVN